MTRNTTPPKWGSYDCICNGWHDERSEADAKLAAAKPRPIERKRPEHTGLILSGLGMAIAALFIGTTMPEFEPCPREKCAVELEDVK